MVQMEGAGQYVRGHRATPSQESNTLSQASCTTTLSGCSDWEYADVHPKHNR